MSKSEEKKEKKGSLSEEQRKSIEDILQDEEKKKILERFVDSLQDKEDLDLIKKGLLFLEAVSKYKIRKASERLGVAHIIYRKHLAKDSYLFMNFIDTEVSQRIFKFIDTEINKDIEKQENASRKLFDEAIDQVFQFMTPSVFHPFFKSKLYKESASISIVVKKLKETRIF